MSLRRKIFYAFTLAIIALILVLPATGWLARMQLLPFLRQDAVRSTESRGAPSEERTARFDVSARKAISGSGGSFDLRYAYALEGDTSQVVARLERLNTDFPQNPAVLAALVRCMTLKAVQVKRAEQKELGSTTYLTIEEKPCNPAVVAGFITYAKQGEAIEPQNAFFPAMAAVGYFASGQDEAAIAAWVRAGEKPNWDEHFSQEVMARWELRRAVNGGNEVGSIARMDTMMSILLPHFASLRSSARMATVHAVRAELAGRHADGVVLRRATRRVGEKIVTGSKHTITTFVGQAVIGIASERPGGATLTAAMKRIPAKDQAREKRARYTDYLQKIGHDDEAREYESSLTRGRAVHRLWKDGRQRTYLGLGEKAYRLLGGWCLSLLMIAGVFFSLAFAAIFAAVHQLSPRLRSGEPLQRSARWGVAMGLFLPLVAVPTAIYLPQEWAAMERVTLIIIVGALAGTVLVATLIVPLVLLRLTPRETGHGVLVTLGTFGALALLIGAGMCCGIFAGPVLEMLWYILLIRGGDEEISWTFSGEGLRSGIVVFSVPVGLIAVFGLFSRILRVPFAAGVTRGMRAMGVPLAAVFALLWAGLLFYTLGQEQAAIREMERTVVIGQAQHIAEIMGKPFPK